MAIPSEIYGSGDSGGDSESDSSTEEADAVARGRRRARRRMAGFDEGRGLGADDAEGVGDEDTGMIESGAPGGGRTDTVTDPRPEQRPNEDPQDADDPSDAPSASPPSGSDDGVEEGQNPAGPGGPAPFPGTGSEDSGSDDGVEEGQNPAGPGGPAPGPGTGSEDANTPSRPDPSTPQGPTGTQPTPDSVDLSSQEYEENYVPNDNGVGTGLASIGAANRLDRALAEQGIKDAEYTSVNGDVVARYEQNGTTQYVPIDMDGGGLTQSVEQSAATQSAVNQVELEKPTFERGEDFTVSVEDGQPNVSLTESGQEQIEQQQQDLRAGAAAATSGSGELARGTSVTDFEGIQDEIEDIRQKIKSQNPGVEGDDFTVGISDSGEVTVNPASGTGDGTQSPSAGGNVDNPPGTPRSRAGATGDTGDNLPESNENVTGLAGIVGLDAQTVRNINEASENVLDTAFTGEGYDEKGNIGPGVSWSGGNIDLLANEESGSLNTDVTDALTKSGGFLTEEEEQDLRERANRLSNEYAFVGDTFEDTVSGVTGSETGGWFAGLVGDTIGNAPANVDRGILAAETGVETVQNSPDVGVADTLGAAGAVTGALTEQTVERAQNNPKQFAGEIAAGAVVGTAAFKGIEKAGDISRAASLTGTDTVDYSDITDERGAQGDLPYFDTSPRSPTRESVSEVSERAADQPPAVSEVGNLGIPEAIGFRMGELAAPRVRTAKKVIDQPLSAGGSLGYRAGTQTRNTIQTIEDAVSQDIGTSSLPDPTGVSVASSQRRATAARDIVGRPLDAAEDAGFRAGESVGKGVQTGQNLVDQPLSAGESLGYRAGESVGKGVQTGLNLVDQPLSVAEEAGYHAGESAGHALTLAKSVASEKKPKLSDSTFGERAKSQLKTVDEMAFAPAEEFGRDVGESVGKSISDIEARRDNPRPLSSVLYHGTQAEFDAEFDVGEGASELPGLFTSPEASPIALQGGTGTGWPSPTLKPRLPNIGGKSDRFIGLPGDDIQGMAEDATGAAYAVKQGDEILDTGLGRKEARSKASDIEDGEMASDPTTSGYEFLTESADPGTAYVRPQGGRTPELEAIFPPDSAFTKTGTVAVRVGRKQLPGTDFDIPGTGRKVPLDLFERADGSAGDSSPGPSLEDLDEGESTTAVAVSRDLDRLGDAEGSVAAGGAYTGGAASVLGTASSAGGAGPDATDTGSVSEAEPDFISGETVTSMDVGESSLTGFDDGLWDDSSMVSVDGTSESGSDISSVTSSTLPWGSGSSSATGSGGSGSPTSGGESFPPSTGGSPPSSGPGSSSPPGSGSSPPSRGGTPTGGGSSPPTSGGGGPPAGGGSSPPFYSPSDDSTPENRRKPFPEFGTDSKDSDEKRRKDRDKIFADLFENPTISPDAAMDFDPFGNSDDSGEDPVASDLDDLF